MLYYYNICLNTFCFDNLFNIRIYIFYYNNTFKVNQLSKSMGDGDSNKLKKVERDYPTKFEDVVKEMGVNSHIFILNIFPLNGEVMVSLRNGNNNIHSAYGINPDRAASDLMEKIQALPDYIIKFNPIELYFHWTEGRKTKYPNRAIKTLDKLIRERIYKNESA